MKRMNPTNSAILLGEFIHKKSNKLKEHSKDICIFEKESFTTQNL